MKESLLNFIYFLNKPSSLEDYAIFRTKDFFNLLFLTLLIVIPFGLLLECFGMDQFDNRSEYMLKNDKWLFIFSGIFLAPVLEEPIFRLHLDLKKSSIWWGIGLSLLLLGGLWWLVLAFSAYLFFLVYRLDQKDSLSLKSVLWISGAFFALIHMGNFSGFDYSKNVYWVPFLVGAQFLVGLVLSYIRLNYGMGWSVIFHGAYNAVLIISEILFYDV